MKWHFTNFKQSKCHILEGKGRKVGAWTRLAMAMTRVSLVLKSKACPTLPYWDSQPACSLIHSFTLIFSPRHPPPAPDVFFHQKSLKMIVETLGLSLNQPQLKSGPAHNKRPFHCPEPTPHR